MNIGKIIAIEYSKLTARIATGIRGNSINLRGKPYYFGDIGGYLKTTNALNETIVCEVTAIKDSDPHKERQSFNFESERELTLMPIGTITPTEQDGDFNLGIGVYPSLYSDVSILTDEDMDIVLKEKESATPECSRDSSRTFKLGASKRLINYPVRVNINKFFQIHSAVLGNTGSGKSNTIAHILQDVLGRKTAAHGAKIILFDANDEYRAAFERIKENSDSNINIKYYRPNISEQQDDYEPFFLPYFLLNLEEWSGFLLAAKAVQRPFWARVLQESYKFSILAAEDKDEKRLVPCYLLSRICDFIGNALGKPENDSGRIGSAKGILDSIQDLSEKDPEIKGLLDKTVTCNGKEKKVQCYLNCLREKTTIDHGDNKNAMANALKNIRAGIQEEVKEVETKMRCYEKGKWYNWEYLKIATEICLIDEDSKNNKDTRNFVSTLITRLDRFLKNPNCQFMRGLPDVETPEKYLNKILGGVADTQEKKVQLAVIDVSALDPDVLEILTSVFTRVIYDNKRLKEVKERTRKPVHLILDEAHRYIKKDYPYFLEENIFDKIAREGRKHSCYLMISSQRPSDLSTTVLSQCGNFIVHRIHNEEDLRSVRSSLPFFTPDLVEKIRQSVPGEALVFGNCVPMPLQIAVDKANPEPSSSNCDIYKEWYEVGEGEPPLSQKTAANAILKY